MRAFIALCLYFLALPCLAADTPDMSLYLKKTDIFDGDVRGTYRSLLLKQPAAIVQKTVISSTTIFPQDGADIANLDASNILQGILPWARLDVMTGGDLSGYLPAPQVIDDSHNHSAVSVIGFTTSTGTTLEIAQATTTANATLLASSPTLSGTWAFINPINGSITGNAGTVTNGLYTSSPLNWANLYNYPNQCGAGYAIQSASNTITCVALPTFSQNFDLAQATGTLAWSSLSNFPASCAPQCVVAVGTTLTCGACGGSSSGGGNAYTTGGVIGQIPFYVAADSFTASGLIPSRVRTTTTAITGADVNADILLSTNPAVVKEGQENTFGTIYPQYMAAVYGYRYSEAGGGMTGLQLLSNAGSSSALFLYPEDDINYPGMVQLSSPNLDYTSDENGEYTLYKSSHVWGTWSTVTRNYRYNFLSGNMWLQGQLTATAGINPTSVNLSTIASSDNNFSVPQTFQAGLTAPIVYISSAVSIVGVGNAISNSFWGYSASYPVVVIGNRNGPTGGSGTVAIGYDPIGNPNGAFSGDGKEVLFPNGVRFATPNDANNSFWLTTLNMKDGKVGLYGVPNPTVGFERVCPSGFTSIKAGDNQLGCMQTDRSAGTATYWAANDYCFDNYGGRLPSLSEFYIAAANYTLTNPTGQWQWVSDYGGGSSGCGRTGSTAVTDPASDFCANSNYYRCWIPK